MRRFSHPAQRDRPQAGIMPWPIRRLTGEGMRILDGGVVIEEPLEVRIDGRPAAVLMRTPGLEKELAVGFCLGEGLVSRMADIALVQHCGQAVAHEEAETDPLDVSRNRVEVRLLPGASPAAGPDAVPLIRSGCGRSGAGTLVEHLQPVEDGVQMQWETLTHLPARLTRRQTAYRAAGGIHAAALFDRSGRVIVVC
ncbi:MAG TPA: hypothetical protein ENJ31_13075, partial [Anaerolineae bacterium]|nr:hypothetical protein [Anaerolineae bacterium]